MSNTIRTQIVEVARMMYEKQMVNAFEGNISIRSGDSLFITPSAICKGLLQPQMIVEMTLDGTVIQGQSKPSSEYKLHAAAYRNRQDIGAVVHAHPPYATAFAVANKPIATKGYPEMIVLFDHVPLAAYGTPSTEAVHQSVLPHLATHDIILLANHGLMAVGKTLHQAYFRLESAESMAKVLLLTRLLGGEKELPDHELQTLRTMGKEISN